MARMPAEQPETRQDYSYPGPRLIAASHAVASACQPSRLHSHLRIFQSILGGFMIARPRLFQCGPIFATALAYSMLSTAAGAYTQEQEQLCSGDAFRLCGHDIPDADRATA